MNGAGSPYGQPPAWQEHRTPDGRAYYYNAATKVTQWTKPEDMMTPAEVWIDLRALANQPWKEYTAEGGRKYWYNTETKTSSWEMPDLYKKALGATSGPSTPAYGCSDPQFPSSTDSNRPAPYDRGAPSDRYSNDRYDSYRDHRDTFHESRQLTFGNDTTAKAFVPASNEPEFATQEEAEAAFNKLLKRSGVQADWTWEQTLRTIAKDPQYRAIKDPKDRKAAFEKYCHDMIVQDKERAKERLTKLRTDFETMLKRHPEIKHYTRWKTARPMIEGETIFRSTDNEAERRQLFEEYIIELKKAHMENQAAMRKTAMDGLIDLLPKLNLEPYTRWSDAQSLISSTTPFQNDEKYKTLSKFDILIAFQNHMKALERAFNDSKQEQKNKKFRKERKARDGFLSLLTELRKDGKINASTKWRQIFPLIENDDRYKAMLGQGGSGPQELFWDLVEEEEKAMRGARNDVYDVIDDERFDITPQTTFEEFYAVMKKSRRTANIDRDILLVLFERAKEKRSLKRSDDERQSERQQRRATDDLRAYLKRMDPPITLDDTYEKVKARLVDTPAFQAVTSEDARIATFDRYVRRLREKEEEADRDRRRRRGRDSSERDLYRERPRSRGERSHRSSGRATRRSRSPEPDAYEADRRKAIAERERNHRKSTMAESLLSVDRERRLSPPHRRERERERDRDRERERERERDRDRDYDRHRSRRDDDGHYERERRDREEERERLYRRRMGSYDELPYGDERPSGSRRRREEDEDDRRDSRDSKNRTPPPAAAPTAAAPKDKEPTTVKDTAKEKETEKEKEKEDPAGVHSGSEEGEIEED
ncbi:pre-mRNA-processing protein prp40 [Colletotrichum spaethianum]|uniref:Pre-mRNA-processing protein prp40 n=1 Tax=Colletotrichum spaethianum TaxID=700344 RepID=A0AA37L165_9PEZI|nr:pre-mRNA-processing protein prp40 [Colletotrichum spaethianum]GKT40078.1 pre-mRNA-processing protein prp40 [Colletotrichum spaethianum]